MIHHVCDELLAVVHTLKRLLDKLKINIHVTYEACCVNWNFVVGKLRGIIKIGPVLILCNDFSHLLQLLKLWISSEHEGEYHLAREVKWILLPFAWLPKRGSNPLVLRE